MRVTRSHQSGNDFFVVFINRSPSSDIDGCVVTSNSAKNSIKQHTFDGDFNSVNDDCESVSSLCLTTSRVSIATWKTFILCADDDDCCVCNIITYICAQLSQCRRSLSPCGGDEKKSFEKIRRRGGDYNSNMDSARKIRFFRHVEFQSFFFCCQPLILTQSGGDVEQQQKQPLGGRMEAASGREKKKECENCWQLKVALHADKTAKLHKL